MSIPTLHTSRLILTPLHRMDPSQMVSFVTTNREHLLQWEPTRVPEYFTDSYWANQIREAQPKAPPLTAVRFVLTHATSEVVGTVRLAEVIGTVNLGQIARGPFLAAYLGYGLGHAFTGRGFMEEALREVIRFAFADLKLHRLMANHLPENTKSERLLGRLGFLREGIARKYLFIHGQWRDHVLNALTNPEEVTPT